LFRMACSCVGLGSLISIILLNVSRSQSLSALNLALAVTSVGLECWQDALCVIDAYVGVRSAVVCQLSSDANMADPCGSDSLTVHRNFFVVSNGNASFVALTPDDFYDDEQPPDLAAYAVNTTTNCLVPQQDGVLGDPSLPLVVYAYDQLYVNISSFAVLNFSKEEIEITAMSQEFSVTLIIVCAACCMLALLIRLVMYISQNRPWRQIAVPMRRVDPIPLPNAALGDKMHIVPVFATCEGAQFVCLPLDCPVCLQRLIQPVVTECDHIFCKACIIGLLVSMQIADQYLCPLCRRHCCVSNTLEISRDLQSLESVESSSESEQI